MECGDSVGLSLIAKTPGVPLDRRFGLEETTVTDVIAEPDLATIIQRKQAPKPRSDRSHRHARIPASLVT